MACQKTEVLASWRTLHTIFHCPALQFSFSCCHGGVKPRRAGTVGQEQGAPMEQPCGHRSKSPSVVTRTASDTRHLTLQSNRYQDFTSAAPSPVTCGSAGIDCKPVHHPEHTNLVDPPIACMASHRGDFSLAVRKPALKRVRGLVQGSLQRLLGC